MGKIHVISGISDLFGRLFSAGDAPEPAARAAATAAASLDKPCASATDVRIASPTVVIGASPMQTHIVEQLRVATTQIVLFGEHASLRVPSAPSTTVYHVHHAGDESAVDDAHIDVAVVLTAHTWDTSLVLRGYNWQKRSVWLVDLAPLALAGASVERHLRMMRTLTSRSSTIVMAFEKLDLRALAGRCNLRVVSLTEAQRVAVGVLRHREATDAAGQVEEMVEWTFELDVASVPRRFRRSGFHVVLIGSDGCLGSWAPEHARRMEKSGRVYKVLVAISLAVQVLEYKYAVTDGERKIAEWEYGWNRMLEVGGVAGEMRVLKDIWRKSG